MSGIHDLIIGGIVLVGWLFGSGRDNERNRGGYRRRRWPDDITEIDYEGALERQKKEIEKRGEENYNRITNDFEKKLKEARNAHEKNIEKTLENIEKKILSQSTEFKNLMRSQRDELIDAIQKEKDIIQSRIDDINEKIKARNLIEREKSLQWLENYGAAINNIKNFDYKKFVSCDVIRLESRLSMAEENDANGNYQSSIATAQQGYIDAEEVLRKVMILTSEWDIAANVALNEIEKLKLFFEDNKKYHLEMDTEDDEKSIEEVDIIFWSSGKFTAVQKELDDLIGKVNEIKSLSVEEIYNLIKMTGEIRAKAIMTIDRSLKNFSAHILRQEMQEVIAEKLSKSGYLVTDNFWENDDAREKNILILRNAEDEKILVTLDYNYEQEKIGFHWETNMKNAHDREIRARSILETINNELGIDTVEGQIVTRPGEDRPAPEESFDVERFKKNFRRGEL